MIRLRDTRYPHTSAFLSEAIRTAEYYGFIPFDSLPDRRRELPKVHLEGDIILTRRDERVLLSSAKLCLARTHGQSDTMLVWRLIEKGRDRSGIPASCLELHVIGAPHAMAEALLIIVSNAIAHEAGIQERVLSVNSIGSKESSNRFIRDIVQFLRKHLESIAPALRQRVATDPLGTLIQLFEKGHPATSRAPQATEYLTDDERKRLWDLLEHLEAFGIPYELNPSILGSRELWAHTLFEIASVDPETGARIPVALGGRYDPLASRITAKETPAALVTIMCEIRGKTKVPDIERTKPTLYFAHLGSEARRRAFAVLETLRRNNIPVFQSMMHDRLGVQMEHSRRSPISHLLIMGHKEAVEGTILVREIATNAQEAVPVEELPSYLRRARAVAV